MLGFAGLCVCALLLMEWIIRARPVLHIAYSMMISPRNRRLYAYGLDVTDNLTFNTVCEMMLRVIVLLMCAYLWNYCFLEGYSFANKGFPTTYCNSGFKCFVSPLTIDAMFYPSSFQSIDCSTPSAFAPTYSYIVNCTRSVDQTAAIWLQHLAVAGALGTLLGRVFELGIYIIFVSALLLNILRAAMVVYIAGMIIAAFSGAINSLATSWLSFLALMSLALIMIFTYLGANVLRSLREDTKKTVENKTKKAFMSIAVKPMRYKSFPEESSIRDHDFEDAAAPASPQHYDTVPEYSSEDKKVV